MGFESGVVPEKWRSTVIVSVYKGKGEREKSEEMVDQKRFRQEVRSLLSFQGNE